MIPLDREKRGCIYNLFSGEIGELGKRSKFFFINEKLVVNMTKDEYKAIKKKGSDLRERLRKRLNVPALPAVSDENYDKIRSIYNSADKQVTKFLNNLESKEFFKTWYPIEYLSEKDVEDIAVIVISRMGNGTTDRKILDNIKKGYLYGNYRFLLYGHRNCDDSIFVEDAELLKYKEPQLSLLLQSAQRENNDISKPHNLCQDIYLLVPLLKLKFKNDTLAEWLVGTREQINLKVYKPDISWIETYINYVDQMVDNLFWLILPYGIKRFYTKKVEESETGAYMYVLNDDLQSRGFKTHNDVYRFIASKHDQIQKELEERLTQIDFMSTNFIEYSDMRAYSYNKRRAVNHDIEQILDDSVKEIKESSGSKNAFIAELKKHMDFEDMMKSGKSKVIKRDQDTYNKKMDRVRLYLKMLKMNGFTNIFTDVPDLEQIVYREAYVFKRMTFKKKRQNAAGILKEYTELCPWVKPKNEEEAEKAKENILSYGYFRIADIDYYNEVISLLLDDKKGYIAKFVEMQSLLSTAKKTPLENEMIKRVNDYDKVAIDEIIAGLNSKECPFPPRSVYVKLARLDESRCPSCTRSLNEATW